MYKDTQHVLMKVKERGFGEAGVVGCVEMPREGEVLKNKKKKV